MRWFHAPLHVARAFLATESAAGYLMLAVTLLALGVANSPWAAAYHTLGHRTLLPGLSLETLVMDGGMTLFFLTVGLELKHEMQDGLLRTAAQALLPLAAAIGGVAAPALLFLAITQHTPEYQAGWAIPTATDIAFAVSVLRLLGSRVPRAALMFLLALAIYDDLAAILIITLFYGHAPTLLSLLACAPALLVLVGLNRLRVARIWPYLVAGALLWWLIARAGIHPTLAGVLTALCIPTHRRDGSPVLVRLLHGLHPYVAFGVLPVFAFLSAGVSLDSLPEGAAQHPLTLAIAIALVVGKPLGITLASIGCAALFMGGVPKELPLRTLIGLGLVAGIGFTMSLFIGDLAFATNAERQLVTLGVMVGSLLAALLGASWIRLGRAVPV